LGYCKQTALPAAEPVSLADAKSFLRIGTSEDDSLIAGLVQAAREYGEALTGRALAKRTFCMVLDSFPYFTDTIQSQLAYPPSFYSLPRYSTTLWNYSQMIKLPYAPVESVQNMKYVDSTGAIQTLQQDIDFVLDRITEPARIFPQAGQYWPPSLYVANSLEINFTAGYDPSPSATDTHNVAANPPQQQASSLVVTGIPQMYRSAILMLVAHWYDHRWAASPDALKDIPHGIGVLFGCNAIYDFAPSRG